MFLSGMVCGGQSDIHGHPIGYWDEGKRGSDAMDLATCLKWEGATLFYEKEIKNLKFMKTRSI